MTIPAPDLPARAHAVLYAVTGAAPEAADAGPLALVLAEELAAPPVDFARLAARWVELRDVSPGRDSTRRLLDHLAARQRPPGPHDPVATLIGLPLALPTALATFHSPRDLLSTAYHVARVTASDEGLAWGTVALAVAAARFLLSKGDFIPDVLEALAVNDAPASLRDAIRRVPLLPPEPPAGGRGGEDPTATGAVVDALWAAYRCPAGEPAIAWLDRAGLRADALVAAAGLLAAREGVARLPRAWVPVGAMRERCDALAVRLAGPDRFGPIG